ncbi:hypothetical protein Bbelb_255700 [Branchiostoma belcheri]|nr:hypothetical protein Bbelb_255700 [Branchiostoma belcheri]
MEFYCTAYVVCRVMSRDLKNTQKLSEVIGVLTCSVARTDNIPDIQTSVDECLVLSQNKNQSCVVVTVVRHPRALLKSKEVGGSYHIEKEGLEGSLDKVQAFVEQGRVMEATPKSTAIGFRKDLLQHQPPPAAAADQPDETPLLMGLRHGLLVFIRSARPRELLRYSDNKRKGQLSRSFRPTFFCSSLPYLFGLTTCRYAVDQTKNPRDKESYRKGWYGHPSLTPDPQGTVRDGPGIVMYDNSCQRHRYVMNRDPHFFKKTVSGRRIALQVKRHVGFASGYSMDNYSARFPSPTVDDNEDIIVSTSLQKPTSRIPPPARETAPPPARAREHPATGTIERPAAGTIERPAAGTRGQATLNPWLRRTKKKPKTDVRMRTQGRGSPRVSIDKRQCGHDTTNFETCEEATQCAKGGKNDQNQKALLSHVYLLQAVTCIFYKHMDNRNSNPLLNAWEGEKGYNSISRRPCGACQVYLRLWYFADYCDKETCSLAKKLALLGQERVIALAVLHFNKNAHRSQSHIKCGTSMFSIHYPKYKKGYTFCGKCWR